MSFGQDVGVGRSIDRRDFVRMCAILGIALPLIGCGDASGGADEPDDTSGVLGQDGPSGRSVVVVGAGAAGLTAAHLLTRAGVDVKVFEASSSFGGRIRQLDGFVDFPIPLGAEWLHAHPDTLDRIVDDRAVDVGIDTIGYRNDDTIGYYDGELTIEEVGDRVVVTDRRGTTEEADAVIVAVPVTVLRRRGIGFVPELSADKWAATDGVDVWGGLKAFFEFDRAFYPTFLEFPDSDTDAGQRLYYDAAYGQDSSAHLLGLFAVGAPAESYLALEGDEQRDHILAELDEVFDGAASRHYLQHVVQNWSAVHVAVNSARVAGEQLLADL